MYIYIYRERERARDLFIRAFVFSAKAAEGGRGRDSVRLLIYKKRTPDLKILITPIIILQH